MPKLPLLLLPKPVPSARARPPGGPGRVKPLSPDRQLERLGPKLLELEAAFEAKRVAVQTSPAGLIPEEVLVLETAGSVEDFFKAIKKVNGLELLGEYDEDDLPVDEDFFSVSRTGEHKRFRGRIYLMFTNQRGLAQLLSLWRRWQKGGKLARGLTKWHQVFGLLRDIRRWSVDDRLEETGVLQDWRERLVSEPAEVPCEIELWCRSSGVQRQRASELVRARVAEIGGRVLSESQVPEISYHAMAVRLPSAKAEELFDKELRNSVRLVQVEHIQFFRASGQMAGPVSIDHVSPLSQLLSDPLPPPAAQPAVALLDGLPLQSHRALAGRLSIDDPDGFEAGYEARFRLHGTAMASLIIWGDLHKKTAPIPQPLYVRPIMQPFSIPGWDRPPEERVPEGQLAVDLIHRAVRRMFEGEGSEPPSAPNVAAINLSIGIADRPFHGTLSPLARMLDWLSWKYNVLFLVSAGNQRAPIDLGVPWAELKNKSLEDLHRRLARASSEETWNRRLLSPAEGMNVLTVGATHEDEDDSVVRQNWIDPVEKGFPSLVNAHGPGYKRSVKPEVLAPGGRAVFVSPYADSSTTLGFPGISSYSPGQRVAAPGLPGDIAASIFTRGTSNATALMTRTAALLIPVVESLRNREDGAYVGEVPDATWLKAFLVHGARWDKAGVAYREFFKAPRNGRQLASQLASFLGFGRVDSARVEECTESRVTAVAGGTIFADLGLEHRLPLPPSLSGKRGWRSLVVTLAWMTPVYPLSHRWRRARLWFESPSSKLATGSGEHLERVDADWMAAQRGTVQHEVFEGEKAAAFVDGDDILVRVSCRKDAGVLTDPVPYALLVTLEVDSAMEIDIYHEVQQRILQKLVVSAGSAV